MTGPERGSPQRDPARLDLRPAAGERQRGVDVLGVPALADPLPGLAAGFAEVPEIERQHGETRCGEPGFVLAERHLVRRAAAVHEHERRMRPRPVRDGEPGRALVAAGTKGGAHHPSIKYVVREPS
nr:MULTISPECIES: hypothetical protein [Amycolatopsis]